MEKSINFRIKQLRIHLGLSQAEFGESIGKDGPSISRYEKNINSPTVRTIHKICEKHGVTKTWLMDGIGSTFVNKEGTISFGFGSQHGKPIIADVDLNPESTTVIKVGELNAIREENKTLRDQVKQLFGMVSHLRSLLTPKQLGELKVIKWPSIPKEIDLITYKKVA